MRDLVERCTEALWGLCGTGRGQQGQGVLEYAVLLAFLAASALVAVSVIENQDRVVCWAMGLATDLMDAVMS